MAAQTSVSAFTYPAFERGDVVDHYHGTSVTDPYRGLEDAEAPAVMAWVDEQNTLTRSVLDAVPQRVAIRDRLQTMWNFERFGVPSQRAGLYLYSHNTGLQDQSVLLRANAYDAEPKLLLDPNSFSEDGTASLANHSLSGDGKYLAYAVSASGSDWRTVHVRDLETGEDLAEDHLEWAKFTDLVWHPDHSGFWYGRYPQPAKNEADSLHHQSLYFHRIGTSQAEDVLVMSNQDEPQWGFGAEPTHDGRWLTVGIWVGSAEVNGIRVRSLEKNGEWIDLHMNLDAEYQLVGSEGDTLWFFTNHDAPRGRVISVDLQHPEPEHWNELIPQNADTLRHVSHVGDRLVAQRLHHGRSSVHLYGTDGTDHGALDLPGLGSVRGFEGSPDSDETFFSFTSFTQPRTIYRADVSTLETELFRAPDVDFSGSDYETEQVFVKSPAGTEVPVFLTHRKGLVLDGTNPTLLYGYGGFNIPIQPAFSVPISVWLEMGGVFASANLRGGGEYGQDWHKAGTLDKKQNVFDDFIAVGEWLIHSGYTTPQKLAIHGRSNGGLLVGATMLQRPDLFGAALPGVGVLDMLRYHKFTIGWAWASDYGTSDDPQVFPYLLAYSPVHNAVPKAYPPTLITTADHDDRVVPLHSYKFAAALQHAQMGAAPILLRVDVKAGHGAGKSVNMAKEEWADRWAFLVDSLGMALEW
ncbi:MAG: prolyl oligopeptidase family serine peptidase [Rhodobacterales bacterium]|nr:prolyl oligopeptidase family serine peptidase [Rhodobacterales bacterium]